MTFSAKSRTNYGMDDVGPEMSARNRRVEIRLTDAEFRDLHQAAKHSGLAMSVYMRAAAIKEMRGALAAAICDNGIERGPS